MGFMDRAKQLAEQAQQKLDEQQTKFPPNLPSATPRTGNESQKASHAAPGSAAPPAPAAAPSAPAPPSPASQTDAERIAPLPLSSGDPLKR